MISESDTFIWQPYVSISTDLLLLLLLLLLASSWAAWLDTGNLSNCDAAMKSCKPGPSRTLLLLVVLGAAAGGTSAAPPAAAAAAAAAASLL
jgi:hypothetical protein